MQQSSDPCNTSTLVAALKEAGLDARVYEGDDGESRAIVPVLDRTTDEAISDAQNPEIRGYLDLTAEAWSEPAFLYLIAEGGSGGCQVGAIGRRGEKGDEYRSDEWKQADTLQEAVDAFQSLWKRRDSLINIFVGGA